MSNTEPMATATLEFDPARLIIGDDADLRQGLSAVAMNGRDLWLACDEGCRLERLTRAASGLTFSGHQVFPLEDLVTLPADPEEEADIEGMDVDDGWLWLVGSHSLKRKKPKKDDSPKDAARKLAVTERDGNRHLLARIPLEERVPRRKAGARRAASIETSPGSSALLDAIASAEDPHLAPFVSLPGKDNGFDIEGLAVKGTRVFVGLRGPVLREWCCILELRLEADGDTLQLVPLKGAIPYRKHFQKLNGLGVRDLLVLENDLLILVGPSMAHDGPSEIWRWKNGAKNGAPTAAPDLRRVMVLPQREGADRAEGFTLVKDRVGATSLLVVFDTPARARLKHDNAVTADVYRVP